METLSQDLLLSIKSVKCGEREKATAEEKQPKEIQGNDTECTRSEFMCRQAVFLIQMACGCILIKESIHVYK